MRYCQPRALTALIVSAATLLWAGGFASAAQVGGGGSKKHDCLTTFIAAVNRPASNPRHVDCVDGDPACDSDMTVNGRCAIPLQVCANSTALPTCTDNGVLSITVDHALDDGLDPKFDPSFQALQTRIDADLDISEAAGAQPADVCTSASTIGVSIKGPLGSTDKCSRGKKTVKVRTVSKIIGSRTYKDTDVIKMRCYPAAMNGCDPQTLFTSTADRVQRQIYNQSCAVATCHDSQSVRGGLLLEAGASHNDTVNVNPTSPAAAGAGWKRITVTTPDVLGDPETSFLYHKITGDLPDLSYGARMPYKRAKLHSTLREIIRLWIAAGAPVTGWVAGTD